MTDIAAFASLLPPSGALIGLDLGTRTIGLAMSDAERSLAGPGPVIRRKKQASDLAILEGEIEAAGAVGLVLGLPLNMDGSGGPAAQRSRAFGRTLESCFAIPILLWDERLSSEGARAAMAAAGLPPSRQRERIDAFAAAQILQDVLNRLPARTTASLDGQSGAA